MRAVFSQWTKPTALNRSINIGYFEYETFLWSWTLSVELAHRNFSETVLYCDSEAKELLVDNLGLPFNSVYNDFDNIQVCPAFWSYGKFLAYSKQTSPFAHIDSDLFLYNLPTTEELSSPFLFWGSEDNLTHNYKLYQYAVDFVVKAPRPPRILLDDPHSLYSVVNAGLFLVNDLEALNGYLKIVFEFAHAPENQSYLNEKMDGILVICLDQYLLKKYLIEAGIQHRVLIEGEKENNLELFEKGGNYHYLGRLKHTRAHELIQRAKAECGNKYAARISKICEEHRERNPR
jgi:hypothetical protein